MEAPGKGMYVLGASRELKGATVDFESLSPWLQMWGPQTTGSVRSCNAALMRLGEFFWAGSGEATALIKFSEALDPEKVKNQPCLLASYEHPVFREAALPFEDTKPKPGVS